MSFFVFQSMPRPGVDDLQSWTQIAPSVVNSLDHLHQHQRGTASCPFWLIVPFVSLHGTLQRHRTSKWSVLLRIDDQLKHLETCLWNKQQLLLKRIISHILHYIHIMLHYSASSRVLGNPIMVQLRFLYFVCLVVIFFFCVQVKGIAYSIVKTVLIVIRWRNCKGAHYFFFFFFFLTFVTYDFSFISYILGGICYTSRVTVAMFKCGTVYKFCFAFSLYSFHINASSKHWKTFLWGVRFQPCDDWVTFDILNIS